MDIKLNDFFNYLSATAITNLLYVCRFTRNKTLTKFDFVYFLAAGFTSEKHWNSILNKVIYGIVNAISTLTTFDIKWFNFNVDYNQTLNGLKLTLKPKLTLFSILIHFLKYVRSCDTVKEYPSYCPFCSRVETFWQAFEGFYSNLKFSKDNESLLGFDSGTYTDLDVFTSKAAEYFRWFKIENDFCIFFQEFRYGDDLFAAFPSIMLRIYLNSTILVFRQIFPYLHYSDQYKTKHVVASEGVMFLGYFWHKTNINFFYELFDKFDKYNSCYCFKNSLKKPQFGPYYPSAFDIALSIS